MGRKIYKTKTGQPYIKLANGRAKFIKRGSTRRSFTKTVQPKRKKSRFRKMAKKKVQKRSAGMFGKLNTPIMGSFGVVAYESFISPYIPVSGVTKDLAELLGGIYLSKKKGIVGATGRSLVTINTYQLVSGLVGNRLKGLIGGLNTSNSDMSGEY